jgi:hypothetical protein
MISIRQKTALPPQTSTVPVVQPRQSSFLMWTSISVLLLLIYFIYRRLQNKTDEEQTSEEPIPSREPSEYRLSAVRALPTITEENPTILSPSNSSNKFTPLSTSAGTILPLAIGKGTLSFVRKISIIIVFSSF